MRKIISNRAARLGFTLYLEAKGGGRFKPHKSKILAYEEVEVPAGALAVLDEVCVMSSHYGFAAVTKT